MGDEQQAKREERRAYEASFAPAERQHAPGRRTQAETARATATHGIGKTTLVEQESAHQEARGPAQADPIAVAKAVTNGSRHLDTLRSANLAADHYASCEAAFQLKLALEAAHASAASEPQPALSELEAAAAPLLADAFAPSRAAMDEAAPQGDGGRTHWDRDVATWRSAREQAWTSKAVHLAAQLGVDAVIRVDDAPAAHGARGLAHDGIVHLVPTLDPNSSDAANVLAHEFVHIAQSQLPVSGTVADAEHEANTLAAGALLHRPRVGLSRNIAAADTGAPAAKSAAKTKQNDAPPPARGDFRVEVAGPGDYTLVFNSADLRSWPNPALAAFRFYMKDVFPGIADAQIDAVFKANNVTMGPGDPVPAGEHEYLIEIRPAFHNAIVTAVKRIAPGIAVVEPKIGDTKLPSASGSGGGTPRGAGSQAHLARENSDAVSTAVEIDHAVYERLAREFPEATELHGAQAWPALLAFLADHAAEFPQLPHTKAGAASLGVKELKPLLDAFTEHQAAEGDEHGTADKGTEANHGTQAGITDGNENTTRTEGVMDGNQRGTGDSKYGWVRWTPKGEVGIEPDLRHYVAGSELRAKLQWDLTVHPQAWLVLVANHCTYSWTVKHNGKLVDASSNASFHDNSQAYLELDGGPGEYEIAVTATSKHFSTVGHKYTLTRVVAAIPEAAYDRLAFDATHTGPKATFSRDEDDALRLNKGQKALTAAQEITALDLTRGHVDELAKEGKLTSDSLDALDGELDHERKALKDIENETASDTPYIVQGTFVSREDSATESLRLLMSMTRRTAMRGTAKVGVLLHDITTGTPVRHPGDGKQWITGDPAPALERAEVDALEDMAKDFHAHNDYAKGTAHLAVQRLESGAVWEKTIDTNNGRKTGQRVLHGIAMVGGALLMIVPGGQPLAVAVIVVTTAATTASIAIDIQDRISKEGSLKFDRRLVMDVLQIATVALPFGGMTKLLSEASQVGKTGFALSMVALDGTQGFLMAQDVRNQLILIEANAEQELADAKTDEERAAVRERRDQHVAQVLGGAVTSGAFMLISMGGGLKHVVATARGGHMFNVREPIAQIAKAGRAQMEQTLTDGTFSNGEERVEITADERKYLEHQLAAHEPAATDEPTAVAPSTKEAHAHAPEPTDEQAPDKDESQKAPHERTTMRGINAIEPRVEPTTEPEPTAPTIQHQPEPTHGHAQDKDESQKAPHERTTLRGMQAVDPTVAPSAEPTGVVFQGRGDHIGPLAARVKPDGNYFDVVVHGDGKEFAVLHDGEWATIKPNSVRKYIRAQKGYRGQPIRLLSCEAGAQGAITAQAIADGMNVHVKAPSEKLWLLEQYNGDVDLLIGNDSNIETGTWVEFDPHGTSVKVPAEPTVPSGESQLPPHERTTQRMAAQPAPTTDANESPSHDGSVQATSLAKPLPEMTPAERSAVETAVDKHVNRIRDERVQGATPAAEKRVRDAANTAAERIYRERRGSGQPEAGARKAAADAGKLVADSEWTTEAANLAVAEAERAIVEGTVFDRSTMSPEAKAQLDAYRGGAATEGAAARKYSTALSDTMSLAEMESILEPALEAGGVSRETQVIKGPPPSGKQTQIAYYFSDGSVIRLKPSGDQFNEWRPSYSVEVKTAGAPTGASAPAMIAFKVDQQGHAVPKDPDQIANPYVDGKFREQRTSYNQHVLNAGHRTAQ